jgi:hypothetical protein
MRWLFGIILILMMLFCIYGVLATFEPHPQSLAFRYGYIVIGSLCFLGTLALGWSAKKHKSLR